VSRAVRLAQVIDDLASRLPALRLDELRTLVAESAPGTRSLVDLQDYLAGHPDALRSGEQTLPVAMLRILHALEGRPDVQVVVPGCADCGTRGPLPGRRPDLARICRRCAKARESTAECSRCGLHQRVACRTEGGPLCHQCYVKEPSLRELCMKCQTPRRVSVRLPDGAAL
jgi:hypothetical protein